APSLEKEHDLISVAPLQHRSKAKLNLNILQHLLHAARRASRPRRIGNAQLAIPCRSASSWKEQQLLEARGRRVQLRRFIKTSRGTNNRSVHRNAFSAAALWFKATPRPLQMLIPAE